MSALQPRLAVFGVVALGGLLIGLQQCHSSEPTALSPESPSSPAAARAAARAQPVDAWSAEPDSMPVAPRPSAVDAPVADAEEHAETSPKTFGTTDNTLNTALKGLDTHDLELYGNIERQLRRDVPPEVRQLVTLKKGGASRQQLETEIKKAAPDLQLHQLLKRWLDASFGGASAPAAPLPGTSSAAGPKLVKPLAHQ